MPTTVRPDYDALIVELISLDSQASHLWDRADEMTDFENAIDFVYERAAEIHCELRETHPRRWNRHVLRAGPDSTSIGWIV